jgi:lipid-A-disaccharide synthase
VKYYVIAGEASGDLHGANLLAELKKLDPQAAFRCWGGDKMKAEGANIVKHIKDLAFMGFVEVVMNIRTIKKNIDFCKKDILDYKPDVLILVDYPGFNLRMAEYAHSKGVKVFFYISPSVWAWKESRVEIIKRAVDHMFVILPFEKPFYAKHNCVVDYEGHPLVDEVEKVKKQLPSFDAFVKENGLTGKPLITCMPGSRKQEIKVILPAMLNLRKDFPDYEFVIGAAPNLPESYYRSVADLGETKLLYSKAYPAMYHSKAGLIKSGTSVLEAALFHLPQVCCYAGNAISIWIAKRVANVKYISLPNLILDRPVVTELIQEDMNYERMKQELNGLLNDAGRRKKMEEEYAKLDQVLGGPGASERIAKKMYGYLINKN